MKIPVLATEKKLLTIINIGEKGDGIARIGNFVIIIPNGQIGKTYYTKIKKVFDKYAIGEIINEVDDNGIKKENA